MTIRTVTYDDAVHKFVLLEPTEAMMHAAEDVPSPRPYGAVYRAMIAVSPPFTSLPNPDLMAVEYALCEALKLDCENPYFNGALAALKRLKGDV